MCPNILFSRKIVIPLSIFKVRVEIVMLKSERGDMTHAHYMHTINIACEEPLLQLQANTILYLPPHSHRNTIQFLWLVNCKEHSSGAIPEVASS